MIFGALVVILTIVTLVFLVWPVMRQPASHDTVARDQQNIAIAREKKKVLEQQLAAEQMSQEEFDAAMSDLETSLAIDLERHQSLQNKQHAGKWAVWFFAAFVPLLSFYIYWQLGAYQVIENPQLTQPRNTAQAGHGSGGSAPSIEEMIDKVKAHLRENPDDSRGWFMLGRTYLTMQQFDKAAIALERSYELKQDEPAIMLALADAQAMLQDGQMAGRPQELVLKALELEPRDPTALWLAGLTAEQSGRIRDAYEYWTTLLPLLEDDPQSAAEIKILLAELKKKQPDLPSIDSSAVPAVTGVAVSVTLDSQFNDKVKADDLLFIYAKADSGPPMPLAAKRLKVSDLPVQLTLEDKDAMMPQMKLSAFDQIIVGARISPSGNPIAQPGDLYIESQVVDYKNDTAVVNLQINRIKP